MELLRRELQNTRTMLARADPVEVWAAAGSVPKASEIWHECAESECITRRHFSEAEGSLRRAVHDGAAGFRRKSVFQATPVLGAVPAGEQPAKLFLLTYRMQQDRTSGARLETEPCGVSVPARRRRSMSPALLTWLSSVSTVAAT